MCVSCEFKYSFVQKINEVKANVEKYDWCSECWVSGLLTVFTVPFMVLKLCTLDMCYICYSTLLIALKIVRMAGHGVSHSPLYIWKYEVNINRYY